MLLLAHKKNNLFFNETQSQNNVLINIQLRTNQSYGKKSCLEL